MMKTKKTLKFLVVCVTLLSVLASSMLPIWASTTYNFTKELSDDDGNYMNFVLSVKSTGTTPEQANSGGYYRTPDDEDLLPTTHYVFLQCTVYAFYADERAIGYGHVAFNEIRFLDPSTSYFVNTGSGKYGTTTYYFEEGRGVYKVTSSMYLSFVNYATTEEDVGNLRCNLTRFVGSFTSSS